MGSGCGRYGTAVVDPDAPVACQKASGSDGVHTTSAPEPVVKPSTTLKDGDPLKKPSDSISTAAGAECARESSPASDVPHLRVATWNMAAINNNPFEYWMTHDDERYDKVMCGIQEIIDAPSDEFDVAIDVVFTDAMWEELKADMAAQSWSGLAATEAMWVDHFRNRKIISEFVKDTGIGEKRLASMPDRTTNTINVSGGSVFRPSVINGYCEGDMGDVASWWPLWRSFFFRQQISILPPKGGGEPKSVLPCELLQPISKAKYPAVTEEEEAISIPLSCLCLAIFDAILVHILWELSDRSGQWQELRHSIRTALGDRKVQRSLEILDEHYADCDLVYLQEVAASCISEIQAPPSLSSRYFVLHQLRPAAIQQDQNSVVLVSRRHFSADSVEDIYDQVEQQFSPDAQVPLSPGDLVVAIVTSSGHGVYPKDKRLLVSSFHGDTNGLHTLPVVTAVTSALNQINKAAAEPVHAIFGMDANTYKKAKPNKLAGLGEFADSVAQLGLMSCWGDCPDVSRYTTFHARTYLQPQLNKAIGRRDLRTKADANCKDHILLDRTAFHLLEPPGVLLDNTGKGPGEFVQDVAFPTLNFPSDHAVVTCRLGLRSPPAVAAVVAVPEEVVGLEKVREEEEAPVAVPERQ